MASASAAQRAKRDRPPWNHNIHYHPLILAAVPPGSRRALDVGCGTGLLARELRQAVPHVSAIDADAPVLSRARQQDGDSGVKYLHGNTYRQLRRIAEAALPGVWYRRHLLFRYSLRWIRPVG